MMPAGDPILANSEPIMERGVETPVGVASRAGFRPTRWMWFYLAGVGVMYALHFQLVRQLRR